MIEVLELHLRTQNNSIVISLERGFQLGHSSGAVFSIWRLLCMSRDNILSTTSVSVMLNWNSCFSFLSEWVTFNCILLTYPLAEVPVAKRKISSNITRNAQRRWSNYIWVINIFCRQGVTYIRVLTAMRLICRKTSYVWRTKYQNLLLSSRLAIVFAQSIEARC